MAENVCPVCYEHLIDGVEILECGHSIHITCLEKHFKAECPLCRKYQAKVRPKGKMPKSSPGRSTRYISSTAYDEIISILPKKECSIEDIRMIEDVLTKKHRGEKPGKRQNILYMDAMKRVGTFSVIVNSIPDEDIHK